LPRVKRFAERYISGTRQTYSLPSVALGKKKNTRHKIFCREPNTRQTDTLNPKRRYLCRVLDFWHSAKGVFAECQLTDTRQIKYFFGWLRGPGGQSARTSRGQPAELIIFLPSNYLFVGLSCYVRGRLSKTLYTSWMKLLYLSSST
jgi:hypothetical protein